MFPRGRSTSPPRRPPSLHSLWRKHDPRSRRPHPRRPSPRIAGRQLLPGRRQQRYLGVTRMNQHQQTTMLSRVADSLYWMSRYLERAEHTARLIDVDLQLRLDQSPDAGSERWLGLLEALQAPAPENGTIDAETLTHLLTLDRTNPSSIISCVAAARENLRQVREQCSSDMWEQLNRLFLHVK